MTLTIEKPKTWKGLSYVLKSSILENAMTESGIDCNVHLVYWTPQRNKKSPWSLIEAEFWLPNTNVDHHRFYIRAGVVQSQDKISAEDLLLKSIPDLIGWMKENLTSVQLDLTKTPKPFKVYFPDSELA